MRRERKEVAVAGLWPVKTRRWLPRRRGEEESEEYEETGDNYPHETAGPGRAARKPVPDNLRVTNNQHLVSRPAAYFYCPQRWDFIRVYRIIIIAIKPALICAHFRLLDRVIVGERKRGKMANGVSFTQVLYCKNKHLKPNYLGRIQLKLLYSYQDPASESPTIPAPGLVWTFALLPAIWFRA